MCRCTETYGPHSRRGRARRNFWCRGECRRSVRIERGGKEDVDDLCQRRAEGEEGVEVEVDDGGVNEPFDSAFEIICPIESQLTDK